MRHGPCFTCTHKFSCPSFLRNGVVSALALLFPKTAAVVESLSSPVSVSMAPDSCRPDPVGAPNGRGSLKEVSSSFCTTSSLFPRLSLLFLLFSLFASPRQLSLTSAISLEPSPGSPAAAQVSSGVAPTPVEKESGNGGQVKVHLKRDEAGRPLPVSAASLFAAEKPHEEEEREVLRVGVDAGDSRREKRAVEPTRMLASIDPQHPSVSAQVVSPAPSSSLTAPPTARPRDEGNNTCVRNNETCQRRERYAEKSIQRHRHDSTSSRESVAFASFGSSKNSFATAYAPFDDEDEEGALAHLKNKVKTAVSCPAAKILLGISGVVALGTLGIKYTRNVLRRRRREGLQRPPTPFTDLLGHVLLKRERGKHAAETRELATGDVLGKPGSVTALYFSGRGVEEMLQTRGYQPFTPRLERIVEGCRERGQELNVVYLSADADSSDAEKHFSDMSWYALPFDDAPGQARIHRLFRKFRVSTLPHVVLLDSNARVLNSHAYASMIVRPTAFPWKKQTPAELLGDAFVAGEGQKVGKDALDNNVVGIYFSASWCPPCQAFTPKLVEALKGWKEQGKDVSVVFVSNDRDEKAFEEYFKKMEGFVAIPFADTTRRALLQEALNVRSLPTLVWLSKEGEVLTRRGVPHVLEDPEGRNFPWKDKDVNDVSDSVEGIADEPALILFMEHLDEKAKEEQEKALEEAMQALQSQKNDGGVPPLPRLFTAKSLSPRSIALRRICRQDLPDADKEKKGPILTIVDLLDQSYFTALQEPGRIFSADEIVAFINKFRREELERNSLAVPE
ncbi:apicoplast-associated thioredoxin family protein Atrx1 [Toxoplasma gondii VAND]|uniref:Apicoplast-associated thioredoxin family protein Atrx1 n=1 Tax=Toxoplasma gondii VAND TaxID=933077 RepID=A0A086QAG2_TOXGO|nr:apicoplast-associated thioredoxin family protein Atrx1 [Toxoplasma gondii VAND]